MTGGAHWPPNGQYLVFDSLPDGSADIFMIPAGGGTSRKLTTESSNEVTPGSSADGNFIYFAPDRSGSWQIWKVDGGAAQQITANGGAENDVMPSLPSALWGAAELRGFDQATLKDANNRQLEFSAGSGMGRWRYRRTAAMHW